jgi:uncharacterized protein involved in exopolysaccharide biosynthesis
MAEIAENKESVQNDEIDLIDIYHKIRDGRKIIYKTTIIFFVIGLLIILTTPNLYTSRSTLLIETGSKSGSVSNLLQQYGGLLGINVNENEEALTPELYPDIIKTYPFLIELLSQKINESKYDSVITVSDYLKLYTKPSLVGRITGFPGKLFRFLKGNSGMKGSQIKKIHNDSLPFRLTQSQYNIANSLSNCINAEKLSSKLNNTLVISVDLQDPQVAAQLNNLVVKSLQYYIINYRTQKAKVDLEFVLNRHFEAEIRYLKAQQALANYQDQHNNIILASSRIEQERLQREYTLAFNIYNSLSQQLEQSKMKVQENTPVFTVINPALVPLQKSKPRIISSIITIFLLGIFSGITIILFKSRKKFIKKSRN